MTAAMLASTHLIAAVFIASSRLCAAASSLRPNCRRSSVEKLLRTSPSRDNALNASGMTVGPNRALLAPTPGCARSAAACAAFNSAKFSSPIDNRVAASVTCRRVCPSTSSPYISSNGSFFGVVDGLSGSGNPERTPRPTSARTTRPGLDGVVAAE